MKNINILTQFSLTGKTAIVTGASRGLGKAMALGLAQAGADVVVADVLDTDPAVKEIETLGVKVLGLKVDVTSPKDIGDMVQKTLQKFKKIDILINNAGVFFPTPVLKMVEKDWDKVMSVNLKGTLMCAKAVGAEMCRQKSGAIINIASIAGIMAIAESAAYNSSKAAIIMLTKTLATEWGKYGVRVNAICPGVMATDMTKDMLADKGFKTMMQTRVPLGRHGTPEDLQGAALYLVSDAANYTTGHALVVDGGWTVGL